MNRHRHKWDKQGRCVNRDWHNCDAERCTATTVQFRRSEPLEMRCRAAVELETGKNAFDPLCVRCRAVKMRYEDTILPAPLLIWWPLA